ncbi:MAG: 5'-nucleotidase C-terminal domain-containing protein [Candidatus Marinimicrobia bacterium]|nr:5'-nucleotidase C-terminal domain-containing protein [Candidatus Neomarinimicrobiota bacterium]
MDEKIGELKTPWVRRSGESNIGNWIADAYRKASGADIAIMNNGGIRKNQEAGPVTVRDIWEIAPFGNRLVTFEWTGEELLEALNNMAIKRRHLQFSGIRLVLEDGGGLVGATVDGDPVDPGSTYTIATNDYSASQAPNYFDMPVPDYRDTGWLDREVMIRAVRENPDINTEVEGRIIYQ